jgi:hypothetical protein
MSGPVTRRGVLAGAAAIAAATALPPLLQASRATRLAIGHLVVDERLVQTATLTGHAAAPRVHTVGALDDLCSRWYRQLRREVLATNGGLIAGLTTWMDYVVMRSCAAEIGYVEQAMSAHRELAALLARLAARESWAHVRTITWVFSPRSV